MENGWEQTQTQFQNPQCWVVQSLRKLKGLILCQSGTNRSVQNHHNFTMDPLLLARKLRRRRGRSILASQLSNAAVTLCTGAVVAMILAALHVSRLNTDRGVPNAPESLPRSRRPGAPMVFGQRQLREARVEHARSGNSDASTPLDFVVAGFPKTGTTTLLYAFRDHEEMDIANSERCSVAHVPLSESRAQQDLNAAVAELSPLRSVKRGIKCPTMLSNSVSLSRLQRHSPSAKLIVGLRHPTELLQSFYNYRVTEVYDKRSHQSIPSFDEIVRTGKAWKGVSLEAVRFDLFLMQLGKTNMSTIDLQQYAGRKHMGVKPSEMQVFLYTLDQIEDRDPTNSLVFRKGLESYLGLETPFQPFGRENTNHFVGNKAYPETLDICQPKYNKLRKKLADQGRKTARWIHERLLESPDVFVGNKDGFLQSLESWGADICHLSSIADVKVLPQRRTLKKPI